MAKKEGVSVPVRTAKRAREPAAKVAAPITSEDGPGPAKQAKIIPNDNPPNKILFAQVNGLNFRFTTFHYIFNHCHSIISAVIILYRSLSHSSPSPTMLYAYTEPTLRHQ